MDPAQPSGNPPKRKIIKKRKYSRGGCKECKRRKMKCDEIKPFCHNCTRLRKQCVYPEKPQSKDHGVIASKTIIDPNNYTKVPGAPKMLPNGNSALIMRHAANCQQSQPIDNPEPHTACTINFNMKLPEKLDPTIGTVATPEDSLLNAQSTPGSTSKDAPPFKYNPAPNCLIFGSFNSPRDPSCTTNSDSNAPSTLSPNFQDLQYLQHPQTPSQFQQGGHNYRGTFRNSISDILSDKEPHYDIQRIFNDASVLVTELNDTVSMDLLQDNSKGVHISPSTDNSIYGDHDAIQGRLPLRGNIKTDSSLMNSVNMDHDFQLDEFTHHIMSKWSPSEYSSSVQGSVTGNSGPRREPFAIPIKTLVEETIKENNLSEPHSTYLKLISSTELSYHLYPFASSIDSNEVVHILLEYSIKCPYLLMALLAMSATLQFNQVEKNGHDLSRQKYLSVCLTLLSKEFNGSTTKSNSKLANDIERLLLTVLLLASNFTATSINNARQDIMTSWKTHLRGAKDLLINYSTVQMPHQSISRGLALAKIWFFAIESLAELMSSQGGTLKKLKKKPLPSDEERERKERAKRNQIGNTDSSKYKVFKDTGYFDKESNPEYHDSLIRSGLLTFDVSNNQLPEFNLYLGYTINVVHMNHEFIKLLNLQRDDTSFKVPVHRLLKLMNLINMARNSHMIKEAIPPSCIIPIESLMHPNSMTNEEKSLPKSAYGYFTCNGVKTIYSWMDISQQIRVDALYLRVLTEMMYLPNDHHMVRELVERIQNYMFFVRPKFGDIQAPTIMAQSKHWYLPHESFDFRCIMIQSSLRIIIPFVQTDLELERLQLFFEGLTLLGNGSAIPVMRQIKQMRNAESYNTEIKHSSELFGFS